jgi:hypothetical protein
MILSYIYEAKYMRNAGMRLIKIFGKEGKHFLSERGRGSQKFARNLRLSSLNLCLMVVLKNSGHKTNSLITYIDIFPFSILKFSRNPLGWRQIPSFLSLHPHLLLAATSRYVMPEIE